MTAPATAQYANAPVPAHQLVPGWRVALIVASFSIAAPAFLNGAQTGLALGFGQAVLAALLAGALLCIGGCLTSVVSVRSRLTTYLLVQRSFGRRGAAVVNLVIALVHYGWFGVNVSFFGIAMVAATEQLYGVQVPFSAFVAVGSVLMTVSTIYGFRTLERLALVAVPLLGAILVWVCVAAVRKHGFVLQPSPDPPVPMGFGIALSALVGGNMLTVAAMPDLSRYIRTARGALAGMALSFPVAAPLLMVAAALPALATGQTDIMKLIVGFGLGVPALAMLVLSCWTINAANLYSASLSLSATFPAVRPWMFTLLGGAIGACFALMGIIDAFIPFLLFLGLIIPPIAAIYVIDGFTVFRHADAAATLRDLPAIRWPALATWAVSVAIALLASACRATLTGVPTLDATLLAAAIYLAVLRLRGRTGAAPTMKDAGA
ncbi:cytosine permease [Pseudoxanthomonas broegbernensis]|uniref:Cytosine permease n=1 Tax=Pseudoxanthomonas broegbernensis TaxID=83619 RepID=A0A7V8GMX7_9GAMM|nr:cytosine permease [Pseudoxanthomonas broegbernensis]KAF1686714.1 cytosine permease [Pseudoxanthomonas broegbernensis]MBB6063522.1 cytosine permease [Pseudoxanthomonas broegbernensis]